MRNDARMNHVLPLPKSLTISAGPSNALKRIVMRPFSNRCAIVSLPEIRC